MNSIFKLLGSSIDTAKEWCESSLGVSDFRFIEDCSGGPFHVYGSSDAGTVFYVDDRKNAVSEISVFFDDCGFGKYEGALDNDVQRTDDPKILHQKLQLTPVRSGIREVPKTAFKLNCETPNGLKQEWEEFHVAGCCLIVYFWQHTQQIAYVSWESL